MVNDADADKDHHNFTDALTDQKKEKMNKNDKKPTRYMHATVFDANSVNAHFFWYKLDAVLTHAEVLNVTHFCHARRTSY